MSPESFPFSLPAPISSQPPTSLTLCLCHSLFQFERTCSSDVSFVKLLLSLLICRVRSGSDSLRRSGRHRRRKSLKKKDTPAEANKAKSEDRLIEEEKVEEGKVQPLFLIQSFV